MMLLSVKEAINTNTVKKELFTDIQSHLANKLKKDAFDYKFWMSDWYNNYLSTLVGLGESKARLLDPNFYQRLLS